MSANIIYKTLGTVETGEIITIFGTNMVNENRTDWIPFFKTLHPNASGFEGVNPKIDGYSAIGPKGGIYVSDIKLMGNQSMEFHVQGPSIFPTQVSNYNAIVSSFGNAGDAWIRLYVSWYSATSSWATSHIKMIDSQGSPSPYYQLYFQPSAGIWPVNKWNAAFDGRSHLINNLSGPLENNRWYCIELHWKSDVSPYVYEAWVDGVQVINANPIHPPTLTYILMGVINASNTDFNFNVYHWWDGFAISKSRVYPASTIEIGNNPVYGLGFERWQEPIYLSDDLSQIKLDLTGLGDGPYYLWITDNQQVRSNPYLITKARFPGH